MNSAQAAISGDMDSFREDDLARGILVRRADVFDNSINGIYVRAEINGVIQPTDAVAYNSNITTGPLSQGGTQNYSFFAPLPYVLIARMEIGSLLQEDTNGTVVQTQDRAYFQPGAVVKFQRGAAIDVVALGASINIGDRTYINEFDANHAISPNTPGFQAPTTGDAQVIFTSFFDDLATSGYRNPTTGVITPIVAPIDSDNGGSVNQPTAANVPTLARWGGISVTSGAVAVIDEATLEFGGGSVNTADSTIGQRDVLAFQGAANSPGGRFRGTTAYITNNNFLDNLQAPISDDPNGLLATDPLTPLVSGNPFFRGNVMTGNDLNGLEIKPETVFNNTNSLTGIDGFTKTYIGYDPNVFTNTLWDDTDLTYILRGTLILAGHELNGLPLPPAPTTGALPELTPSVTLTIESSLPGSPLANGQSIPVPGESAIVKLLNTSTILGDGVNGMPVNVGADDMGGAGFIAGEDNGVDPTADSLIDPGYLSQLRFLGIGGNQTTGQQRVPVILTSVHDNTVGRTVRGVPQFQATNSTAAPVAGDGGVILFGALGLSDYNLLDPRDGSLIDNADIKYMTRIEQQGGGWVYTSTGNDYQDKLGLTVATQFNTAKALTISNSNLSNFSQVAFISHPSGVTQLTVSATGAVIRDAALHGQGTLDFFVDDTFANNPTAVRIVADPPDNATPQNSPSEAVFLNNTFFNNGEAIRTQAPIFDGKNAISHVQFLAMNNIFDDNTINAIHTVGMASSSQGQYNLFDGNANNDLNEPSGGGAGPDYSENQPIFGNPAFRNAAGGEYTQLPFSAAIDSSRSEIGPLLLGDSLQPIVTYNAGETVATRSFIGRDNPFGGAVGFGAHFTSTGDIVSLPGYNLRTGGAGTGNNNGSYFDQFVPVLPTAPGALPPFNGTSTFNYAPIQGERDQSGLLRVDDPNVANVGFGSRPFFDIGAFEFVQLNPPHIAAVTAVINNPAFNPAQPISTSNEPTLTEPFYTAGGIVGANQTPHSITFQFDQRLDPSTVNNLTFVLVASGGDGIFDNGNDKQFDLSGKLSYNAAAETVSIILADSSLSLPNDVYRVEVFGSGGSVVRNPQGLSLDGEDTANNLPTGAQLPLPSGNGFPGGNFFLRFTINNPAPTVVAGSFVLDPASDSGVRDNITDVNTPSFDGSITDVAASINPLLGQTAFVDVSTLGNGVFDRLNVAIGTVDALGNFVATYVPGQAPIADSVRGVGPDGILGTADDTGFTQVRVRVIDQSGNVSLLGDPNAQLKMWVDTLGPQVTAATPAPNSQANAGSGVIPVSISVNENIAASSFSSSTVRVVRAGADGILGTGDDVAVATDANSFTIQNLRTPSGAEILHFNIVGATASDIYEVILPGTGSTPITDIAGNALDGEYNGTFPTGNGVPGGDFDLPFIVFNPAAANTIFVGQSVLDGSQPVGSRSNPFPTITAGLGAATAGDTVAVLPGVYTETVNLKSLVRLISVDTASFAGSLLPGNALDTIIRAPASSNATTTVTATNLISIPSFFTEIAGFSIASPLVGDAARGPINSGSVGISLVNSSILVDKDYFVDSGFGASVSYGGANAIAPRFEDDGFIGNIIGLNLADTSTTSFASGMPVEIANNDFAFNTFGIQQTTNTSSSGPLLGDVVNNIFFENADLSGSRQGAAVFSNVANRLLLRANLFSGNGPSETLPGDDTLNVGNGFNPATLTSTPDANGNIYGSPRFVLPVDPRPGSSGGPGNFFLGANYDLQANSAAIDAAINSDAPALDFRYRGRIDIPNVGHTGFGPADIGAFEFAGTGGEGTGTLIGAAAPSLPSGVSVFTNNLLSSVVSSGGSTTSVPTQTVAQPVTAGPTLGTSKQQKAAAKRAAAHKAALEKAAAHRAALETAAAHKAALEKAAAHKAAALKTAAHKAAALKAATHAKSKPKGPASHAKNFHK